MASLSNTTAAAIRHGPPSGGRTEASNAAGARRMISNLRNNDSMASHSSFLSHSSRRERAEAPACAAAFSAAISWVDGSLGLASLLFGLFVCWI
eukprot:scaffold248469_cov43-Cyclotella_meneghiniana.AAC.5